jgi:uncharacterized iron-regulated membrane protein
MTNKVTRSNKKLLKTIHTWIGIIAGLFLSVIALTGSVILFRAEFERAALPRSTAAGDNSRRASLDDAARAIAIQRPESHIRRVHISAGSGDPYIVQIQSSGKRTERIVADASSGEVLGSLQSGWVDWMVDLHRNLLAGPTGRSTVGAFGIVLFVLSATGILMWLTGPRNWRAWVAVRKGGSATRFNYELHRASGLWAYVFLALISFTGIELAYPNSFRDAVQSVTGKPATVRAPRDKRVAAMLSLDEYVRLGRVAMPDGVPVELRLPESGKGPVDLRLYRAGDLSPSGNHVYLDPASGAVMMIDRVVDRPIGARFLAAMSPIHYAQFGGLTTKIAWALLGLTPVLLFITGLIAWWRPAKSKPTQTVPKETEVSVG